MRFLLKLVTARGRLLPLRERDGHSKDVLLIEASNSMTSGDMGDGCMFGVCTSSPFCLKTVLCIAHGHPSARASL
jgi:hypothetical protein